MILYHYTAEYILPKIKQEGLLPMGLNWLTKSGETENTVNSHGRYTQGRIKVLATKDMLSFPENREKDRDLLSCFMMLEMIDLISDTTNWYYTERLILPEEILAYEILVDGKWKAV